MNAMTTIRPKVPSALTPGGYMRGCRRQSGKSIKDCVAELAIQVDGSEKARADLIALERNRPGDYGRLVRLLRDFAVFPFSYATFISLAAETASPELGEWDEL